MSIVDRLDALHQSIVEDLQDALYNVSMLGLQTDSYHRDPDFCDAVLTGIAMTQDAVLRRHSYD